MNSILSLISTSIRLAVPLGYASIAGSISETAGILALGLEGFMMIGAFMGVLGAFYTGNVMLGILMAAGAGAVFALIFGFFCIQLKSNQVVAGVGMNIIAEGLVSVLMIAIFGSKGKSELVPSLQKLDIPILKNIPIIKDIFSGYTGLAYFLILVMIIAWIVIYKAPIGIRLRATGINSEVVDSLGLRSGLIKYISVAACGAIAAIGGTFLSLSQLNFYSKDMVAGRGYIALAIFVFAKKNPALCVLISLLFGFTEAIHLRMQKFPIPSQFLAMLPYLCTIIVLIVSATNNKKQKLVVK